MAADPEFCRAAGWSPDRSPDEHRRFHEQLVRCPPDGLLRLAAVQDGPVVGYVDLRGEGPARELGFVVGERRRWGAGLGRAVAAAGIDHGVDRLGLQEVWAQAHESNVRSVRLLRHLGLAATRSAGGMLTFSISAHGWRRARAEAASAGSPPAREP